MDISSISTTRRKGKIGLWGKKRKQLECLDPSKGT